MDKDDDFECYIGRYIRDWYNHIASPSLELIECFIKNVEKQNNDLYAEYKEKKETIFIDHDPDGGDPNAVEVVEFYQGLTDQTWSLEDLFKEYFPNLQRRSALLTIYGFFEHELNQLCDKIKNEKLLEISLTDIADTGIDRSKRYLEKVAKVNVSKNPKLWNDITDIQKIRNLIAHQDGNINDKNKKEIMRIIGKTNSLSGEFDIILSDTYLTYTLNTFKKYFELIDESIKLNEAGI